ncbi:HNH endonuclease [Mesorhizobium sp.]|uniref:HNH endonuclease n=1 Tax=Mesorhizobium sp. TaxID=1871066 RepID=UPI0025DF06B6|nr:HNH endonuclease [Mesorhizobium sp.]
MGIIENPPGFVVRTEARKAAFDNGFRIEQGELQGWLGFASTTARGHIFIARGEGGGLWYLALDHPGVIAEIALPQAPLAGPGAARYAFEGLPDIYTAISTAWRFGVSLPDAPLARFDAATRELPRSTEAERMVVQRVGQNIFRTALMDYWQGRCPLTGIAEPELLRASHIVPWAHCKDDAQRLDVHNGLLLSALWDAAFDTGLVSFSDSGQAVASPRLSSEARAWLLFDAAPPLSALTPAHHRNLARHRLSHGYGA